MRWGGRPDMDALAIGDEVLVPIVCLPNVDKQIGKVVYIHPEKRYFTVEFPDSKIRESYCSHGILN